MNLNYEDKTQIIKRFILNKGYDSLINTTELSIKKSSSIIGIGGSHIYFTLLKNFDIVKQYKENIDFENPELFFKNIKEIYESKDFQNKNTVMIFSYPFTPIKKENFTDAKFSSYSKVTKKLPFKKETFLLSSKIGKFNVLNDSVSVNLYNIYKNKNFDIHISALSGTGVNLSYTKDSKVFNSEFGNDKLPKFLLPKIFQNENLTFERLIAQNSIKDLAIRYEIPYSEMLKLSSSLFAQSILSYIDEYKSASLMFQGSFICKEKEYQNMVEKNIYKKYKGRLKITYDNLSDIKGASLI